jgi:phage terminase large subunit-like protein
MSRTWTPDNSYLLEYHARVETGEIIVGQELWQKAFIEAIYSFKMSETTFNRFKKVILLIARKNTKSETCSALALSELI